MPWTRTRLSEHFLFDLEIKRAIQRLGFELKRPELMRLILRLGLRLCETPFVFSFFTFSWRLEGLFSRLWDLVLTCMTIIFDSALTFRHECPRLIFGTWIVYVTRSSTQICSLTKQQEQFMDFRLNFRPADLPILSCGPSQSPQTQKTQHCYSTPHMSVVRARCSRTHSGSVTSFHPPDDIPEVCLLFKHQVSTAY